MSSSVLLLSIGTIGPCTVRFITYTVDFDLLFWYLVSTEKTSRSSCGISTFFINSNKLLAFLTWDFDPQACGWSNFSRYLENCCGGDPIELTIALNWDPTHIDGKIGEMCCYSSSEVHWRLIIKNHITDRYLFLQKILFNKDNNIRSLIIK